MEQPPILHKLLSLSLLLLLNSHLILSLTTPTPPPTLPPTSSPTTPTSKSTLDPKQIRALQSLNIPTTTDPCSNPRILHASAICNTEKPFRHLTSLHLFNCSTDVSLSTTALKSLSTLKDLSFTNCPAAAPTSFPPELASNLQSFTCINSLRKLTGVMLGRLQNVTDLTISSVPIKASGPYVILGNLKNLKKLTLSHTNLTGYIPKSFQSDLTHIDLSNNQLKGPIRSSVTDMDTLVSLDLSSNQFNGELPTTIGDLIGLKNLSVSSNSLSGPIPGSMASMPELEYVDLSSNQFNGSIPNFFSKMKNLKHLNLESNNFQGIMPFNESFIKKLAVFKIGENDNLCYNHTTFTAKLKLGIAKCDKNGYPVSPPAKSVSSGDDEDYSDDSSQDETSQKSGGHHGPNKVVLGVAIALSSIVFLIIFLIFLSKRCV